MTFKGTELKIPGMEITRFLTWSGHNGLLPLYFSPGAQGIGQGQADPLDSSSFGQEFAECEAAFQGSRPPPVSK